MSSLKIVAHPAVIAEAKATYNWYRERSVPAAKAFLTELERAISRIAEKPQIWPLYAHGTQRYLMHHFPFFVVYRLTTDSIEIIAMAHTKRKPEYWKKRLD